MELDRLTKLDWALIAVAVAGLAIAVFYGVYWLVH
jgi:hypothetical protein